LMAKGITIALDGKGYHDGKKGILVVTMVADYYSHIAGFEVINVCDGQMNLI